MVMGMPGDGFAGRGQLHMDGTSGHYGVADWKRKDSRAYS